MKLFDIKLNRYDLFEDGLYIEYVPLNDEIRHYLMNGNTYQLINNSRINKNYGKFKKFKFKDNQCDCL